MGDVYCAKCGEPWDYYGVVHAEDMSPEEAEKFLKGLGCPVCDFGKKCPYCNGQGKGDFECDECYGEGLIYDIETHKWELCPKCRGYGFLKICPKCMGTGKPLKTDRVNHLLSIIDNTDEDPMKFLFL